MKPRRSVPNHTGAARGSVSVPFAIALPVILGFMGLALDLAHLYTRKSEMQQIADSAALAAARELNGTLAGITAAGARAQAAANENYYSFSTKLGDISGWNAEALSFADSPDDSANWKTAGQIGSDAAAKGLLYARVDTRKLGSAGSGLGAVGATFIRVLPGVSDDIEVPATAVAGRVSVQATPLAICAMNSNPAGVRLNPGAAAEKVEYGFRRGVSYNLLDLSPNGTTPHAYLVNPIDPGASPNNVLHFDASVVKQFFCSGTMALEKVGAGSTLHVQTLNVQVEDWLNSRFNLYPAGSGCNPTTAPPDWSVRQFLGSAGYAGWFMNVTPVPPTAKATNRASPVSRVTVADLDAGEASTETITTSSFGPLWTYSRPQPSGTGNLAPNDWPALYKVNGTSVATAKSYPGSNSPYLAHRQIPSSNVGLSQKYRRVLNIPLLQCAAGGPGSPATVLAVGQFFMSSKADVDLIPGEFAGIASADAPTSSVALQK